MDAPDKSHYSVTNGLRALTIYGVMIFVPNYYLQTFFFLYLAMFL